MLTVGYLCLAVAVAWLLAKPASAPVSTLKFLLPETSEAQTGGAIPQVFLLLSPRDCADHIEAMAAWNALSESGNVRVTGIISDQAGDPNLLETIRTGVGISFPLRQIPHPHMASTLRSLNHTSTPVALAVDAQQRLRLAVPFAEYDAGELVESVKVQLQAPHARQPPHELP
jgi:hypothetical protein